MKLREDWKTKCRELKVLKQSIHDHNPINISTSFKPMVNSSFFFINYKKPFYISGTQQKESQVWKPKQRPGLEHPCTE